MSYHDKIINIIYYWLCTHAGTDNEDVSKAIGSPDPAGEYSYFEIITQ